MNFRLPEQEFNFFRPSLVIGINGGQRGFLTEIVCFFHFIAVHHKGLDIFVESLILADAFFQLILRGGINPQVIRSQRGIRLGLRFTEFPDRLLAVFYDQTIQVSLFRFFKNRLAPFPAGLVHTRLNQSFDLLRLAVLFESGIRKNNQRTLIRLTSGTITLFLHQTIALVNLGENIILQYHITIAEFKTLKFNRNGKFDIAVVGFLLCINSRSRNNR